MSIAVYQLFLFVISMISLFGGVGIISWPLSAFVSLLWVYAGIVAVGTLALAVRPFTSPNNDGKDSYRTVAMFNMFQALLRAVFLAVFVTVYSTRFNWKQPSSDDDTLFSQLERQLYWQLFCLAMCLCHMSSLWDFVCYLSLSNRRLRQIPQ
jgi:hypothetical protein